MLSGIGSPHGSEHVGVSVDAGSGRQLPHQPPLQGCQCSVLMPSVNVPVLTPVTMGSCSYLALGAHKLSPPSEPSETGWRAAGTWCVWHFGHCLELCGLKKPCWLTDMLHIQPSNCPHPQLSNEPQAHSHFWALREEQRTRFIQSTVLDQSYSHEVKVALMIPSGKNFKDNPFQDLPFIQEADMKLCQGGSVWI